MQSRNGFEIDFSKSSANSPINFEQAGEFKVAEGLAAGIEASFNPSGKLEIKPSFGIGKGEMAVYGPTIKAYSFNYKPEGEE